MLYCVAREGSKVCCKEAKLRIEVENNCIFGICLDCTDKVPEAIADHLTVPSGLVEIIFAEKKLTSSMDGRVLRGIANRIREELLRDETCTTNYVTT